MIDKDGKVKVTLRYRINHRYRDANPVIFSISGNEGLVDAEEIKR